MAEEPFSLTAETPKENSIKKGQYPINNYIVIIEIDSNYIYFNVHSSNGMPLFHYKNKFDFLNIIKYLGIDDNKYYNLNEIFKLMEESYYNNNLSLEINNKDSIDLNIIILNNKKENVIPIHLEKAELDLNEKFDEVVNQINIIKKNQKLDDRFYAIELLLDDIKYETKERLNKEQKEINIFQERVLKDVNEINQNMDEIKDLKGKIKYYEENKYKLKQ
jgi:hypothetical protein